MMTNTEALQLAAHAASTAGQLRDLSYTCDPECRVLTSCSKLDMSGLVEDLEELALSLLRNRAERPRALTSVPDGPITP